jgi:hypothetical protein
VQKQPTNPDVYIARSNYDAGTNNISAALADLQKALQLDPNPFRLLSESGHAPDARAAV